MSGVMLVLAFVAAINPFRTRLGLPGGERGRLLPVPALIGFPLGAASLIGLSAASGPLLRSLRVTPEVFVIAAGLVAVLSGAWILGFPEPAEEPSPPGWRAGLWPVAYPRIVGPETIAVALAVGVRQGVTASAFGIVAAVGGLAVLGLVPRTPLGDRVLLWLGRIAATLLLVVGVWLMVEGIRDV